MTLLGKFIVFEGGEGSGKTTQTKALRQSLADREIPVFWTREPGGTVVGEKIRAILLDPELGKLPPFAESLLFAADRCAHVEGVIRPMLDNGITVLCDRYIDSTVAYQCDGRQLPERTIRRISEWATNNLYPDLTFVLELDPRVGLDRVIQSRGSADRIESAGEDFHRRVYAGYSRLADESIQGNGRHTARGEYWVVDAAREIQDISAEILEVTTSMFGQEWEKLGGEE